MPSRSPVSSSPRRRSSASADSLGSISFYLGRVYYAYVALLQRLLAETGLDAHVQPGMGHILFALFDQDDIIIKDLAQRVQLSPSTMTGMLKRMERARLIERRSDGTDGRAVRVHLTPLGRSLEGPCRRLLKKLNRLLEAPMNKQELAQVERSLENMVSHMRQLEQRAARAARNARTVILATVAGIVLFAEVAAAQATFGTITGTVKDASGAVLPGVTVTVTAEATNISATVVSDARGNYAATNLNPGAYRVAANLQGFTSFMRRGIVVEALATIRVDVTLAVGEIATEVFVEAGAPVVDSETPTLAQTRTFTHLRDLPTNIRGQAQLYDWIWLTPTGTQGGGSRRSMGGGRSSSTYINVDGISANSPAFGNQLGNLSPPREAMQEVRFEYVNAKAEFAEVGNVTAITKSGGNDFRGSLYWENVHSGLSARSFFSTTGGPVDPQTGEELFTQNNGLGGSLGGPIKRDRAFFFGSYEYNRDTSPAVLAASVPTGKMRAGDFSDLLALERPIRITNPFTGMPFSGNVIPSELLHPGAAAWQQRFYPAPNFGAPASFNQNYRGSFSQKQVVQHVASRVDFQLSQNSRLYGRASYQRRDSNLLRSQLPPELNGFQHSLTMGNQFVLSNTWTLSPTLVSELKVAYSRRSGASRGGPLEGQALIDLLGIQGLPAHPGFRSIPAVSITGFASPFSQHNAGAVEETFQAVEQLTWIRGRHALKTGVEWRPQRYTDPFVPNFGNYDFRNTFTGFSYSDFSLGLPRTTTRRALRDTFHARFFSFGAFLQDDFQVTPNLTLSYGARWDYNSPVVDKFDVLSSFDPATGSVVVPDASALEKVAPQFPSEIPIVTAAEAGFPARSLRERDLNNVAPRLGFAFRPFANASTALRGGYGVYYDDFTAALINGLMVSHGPFDLREIFTNRVEGGTPLLTLTQPFLARGSVGATNVRGIDPGVVNPYTQQWNLTFEQDIGFHTGIRLSYIGTRTSELVYRRNINQPPPSPDKFVQSRRPYPLFNEIIVAQNGGRQRYNAMLLHVERKMRGGLYLQTSWTWAKNLTNVDDTDGLESGTFPENPDDLDRDWGNALSTPRHRLVTNVIWELPVGAGRALLDRPGLLNGLLGGWQVSAIWLAQTGHYLTPEYTGADPANVGIACGGAFTCRPDRIGDGNLPDGAVDRWFDASAFQLPPNGRFGNAGRGIIVGPGRSVLNLGLFKRFAMGDGRWLRVQATATNALNSAVFGDPDMNISSPGSVGSIDSLVAGGRDFGLPREIQFAVRYEF